MAGLRWIEKGIAFFEATLNSQIAELEMDIAIFFKVMYLIRRNIYWQHNAELKSENLHFSLAIFIGTVGSSVAEGLNFGKTFIY